MKLTQLARASACALAFAALPAGAQSYQDSGGTAVPAYVPLAPGVGPLFTSANPGQVLCANCSGGGGGTLTFPDEVAGTVNSGGIPFFSSATVLSSTAVLVANNLMVGGGAGVAPSTVTTNATALTALGVAPTGSGSLVLATSPTLTTPALGTPSAIVLTHGTGLPPTGLSSTTGSGAAVLATSPTLVTPALGTPSAVNLTNAIDVPVNQAIGNLPVANLNSGTSASSSTFWRGDGTWATPAGGPILTPGYQPGPFYTPYMGQPMGSPIAAVNTTSAFCLPVWMPNIMASGGGSGTLGAIGIKVGVAGTSSLQIGIYSNDTTVSPFRPGTLAGTTTAVANTTAGLAATAPFATGLSVSANTLYWFCLESNDTTMTYGTAEANLVNFGYASLIGTTTTLLAGAGSSPPADGVVVNATGGFGTFPSSLHGASMTENQGRIPWFFFQFASIP
jgi:hypothetical protein